MLDMTHKRQPDIDWRGLRNAMGLTQRELADLLCVSRQEIANIEGGRRYPAASSLMLLRVWLTHPTYRERLAEADYPTPFPEDLHALN